MGLDIVPISQEKDGYCGQACVAMITGLPLSIVVEQFGNRPGKGSTTYQIAMSLRWFGWDCEVVENSDLTNIPDLCILIVNCVGSRGLHAVVYHEGFIYDPGYKNGIVIAYSKEAMKFLKYKPKSFLKINL